MLSNRDLLGEEFYKLIVQDYERIRQHRKAIRGEPDIYDRAILDMNKPFERFYKKFLD